LSASEFARIAVTQGHPFALIDFMAEAEHCSVCGAPLNVLKSTVRLVITYAQGAFWAREVHKVCSDDSSHPVEKSAALARIVRPRQRFGYDLIVYVGVARYLRYKQRSEIRQELLDKRSIELSTGTVSNLCDRFLLYLEVLHLVRSPYLKAVLQEHGYSLHLDATSDHGKGGLFLCQDGIRNWVLCAGKIESESEDRLKPFIERTTELFGDPLATVRDLGVPGKNAVAHLEERGVLDFVCHYHFLSRVGQRLFDNPYDLLRSIIKQSRVRTDLHQLQRDLKQYRKIDLKKRRFGPGNIREDLRALVHWIIQGDGKKDAPYPFSLPHLTFFQRSQQARQKAERWVALPRTRAECRALSHLFSLIGRLEKDKRVKDAVGRLEVGWQVFTETREVLRLTDAELPRGDRRYGKLDIPQLEAQRLKQIEQDVGRYLDGLRQRIGNENLTRPTTPHGITLKYFNKYRDKLFGHPVIRDDDGQIIAIVERTNNKDEHWFGAQKQQLRRRVGRAHLGRDLEDQPAQVAYVANLRRPDCVRILCGSLDNLSNAFANLDEQTLNEANPLVRSNRDTALQKRVKALLEHFEKDSDSDEFPLDSAQIAPRPTVV
jgi:hypothetical protein